MLNQNLLSMKFLISIGKSLLTDVYSSVHHSENQNIATQE